MALFNTYERYWPNDKEESTASGVSLEQLHQLAKKRSKGKKSPRGSSKHDKQRNKEAHNTSSQRKSHSTTPGNNVHSNVNAAKSREVVMEESSSLINGRTEETLDLEQTMDDTDSCDSMSDKNITPQTCLAKKKKTRTKQKTKLHVRESSDSPISSEDSSSESDVSDMEVNDTESPSLNQATPADVLDEHCSSTEEDNNDLDTHDTKHTDVPGSEPVFPLVPLTRDKNRLGSSVARVHRQLPQWIVEADIIEDNIQDHSRSLDDFNLPEMIVKNLSRMGVFKLFPVQVHVIPELLSSQHGPLLTERGGTSPRDVCVCAPTGCGKTLCYVVPIVTGLMNRVITQIRAVVVLPSQELALQVLKVFELVSRGTGIKIGMVCGQVSLEKESAVLLDRSSYPPSSGVDVLIATPGRLVEHLNRYSFLTLCFLRYLVVDEADKLLDQHYSQWLPKLLTAVATEKDSNKRAMVDKSHNTLKNTLLNLCTNTGGLQLLQQSSSKVKQAPPAPVLSTITAQPTSPFQKLLFSATMTYNPEHLATINLRHPKLFTVADILDSKYSHDADMAFTLPAQLEESTVKCNAKNKPLVLLHLVTSTELSSFVSKVLCFTNSREATHRLFLLMKVFGLVSVGEMSGLLSQGKRKEMLSDFRSGKIQMLICSDQMARGMDVEGVSCVVNYEAPRHFRTYLHRAGRTARAGLKGVVYTILTYDETHSFNTMLRRAHHSRHMNEISVTQEHLKPFLPLYQTALDQLKAQLHHVHK